MPLKAPEAVLRAALVADATVSGLVGTRIYPLMSTPETPLQLGVYAGDALLAAFEAADHSALLQRHGKGDGRHAFDVPAPPAPPLMPSVRPAAS